MGRMLAEIKTEYTTTGGYEPDSDANTEGFDTEFSETVTVLPPEEDEKEKSGKGMLIVGGTIVLVVLLIVIVAFVMNKSKTDTPTQSGGPQYQVQGTTDPNLNV